jgi:hypothetical protein
MLTVRADQLSEQHLAEIALAIQNRWSVATFVKMHEVIVMDDDDDEEMGSSSESSKIPRSKDEVKKGLEVILHNLELDKAFRIEDRGRNKFQIRLVDSSAIPKWVEKSSSNATQAPDGVYVCPHCGRWCYSELELSMHQKLHYIL